MAETGTFACPVCGVDTPHYHDIDAVNRERVVEGVIRLEFQKAYLGAVEQAWGSLSSVWRKVPSVNDAADPFRRARGLYPQNDYEEPTVEALWRMWLRAWDTAKADALDGRAPREPK